VLRKIPAPWLVLAVCVVGIMLGPVVAGFAPLAGDPEQMYLPIKMELARALSEGRLPFWSDRLGLGVPLAAESHVAAFYPPNWLFYRLLRVETAYCLTMWLHWIALAAATYAYARALEISHAGSALAAISFALCGFQAVHSVHEPFYHVMPYLLLCLYLADRYALTGRIVFLTGLALIWGIQLTLGHFQIQMWTGGLVALTGSWRALTSTGPVPSKLGRTFGLLAGLAWGASIACAQLSLTWELTRVSTFIRPAEFLSTYLFPIVHWAQFVLPEVYLGRPMGMGDPYWGNLHTTSGEACAYIGTVPLILACVGWVSTHRDRAFTPWRLVLPVSLALATMADWWPDAYYMVLQLPGLGWFRAPARYTLLTSLGLVLFAGRGLDYAISKRTFRNGYLLAILLCVAAWAWSTYYARSEDFQAGMGAKTLAMRFTMAGIMWGLGLLTIFCWRVHRVGAWALLVLTVVELGGLFFAGPVGWHWLIRMPEASPLLRHLATLPDVGLVGGRLLNLPVDAGQTVAYPNLGITPPPPNYLLEPAIFPPGHNTGAERRWQQRFGVTHGIWAASDDVRGTMVIAIINDPVLDQVMFDVPLLRGRGLGPWKLVKNRDTLPSAWVARRVRKASSWGELYTELTHSDDSDVAWFLDENNVPPLLEPAARSATVKSWDGRTAVVEHDGSCVLVMRRTYYPGWVCRVNDGPERPVLKVDGGLQGVPLLGSGPSSVLLHYRPTTLRQAATVTLAALTAALLVMAITALKALVKTRWSRASGLRDSSPGTHL
jgi:hypothetical protein